MSSDKKISSAVIRRLPRYYRYLGEIKESGIQRISSNELSNRMKVTASQIRQDLNNFGGFGQQGYGYNVEYLYEEIGKILGIDKTHSMVIVGAGNLGQAIVNSEDFAKRGFIIRGVFDNNKELDGRKIGEHQIMMSDRLPQFIKDENIEILAITVPKDAAREVARVAVEAGIKAIWNFAHTDINVPDNIVVENVHLSDSLMQLSYNVVKNRKQSADN